MPENKSSLALFNECINRLMEEDLILADKNIASLLKCIVSTPILKKCLEDSMQSYSYVTEFTRACVTWTRADGVSERKIKLPADKSRLFAFVVCLLAEIDGGRRNFIDFLRDYFYEQDSNASYCRFVEEVLRPFKKVVTGILQNAECQLNDYDGKAKAKEFFDVETVSIENSIINRVAVCLQNVVNVLKEQFSANEDTLHEYIYICNSLLYAFNYGNPRIIRICWLAFKNAVSGIPQLTEECNYIADVINNFSL